MTISFKDIPDNIRVPLCYIEFDNSAAVKGTPQVLHKTYCWVYVLLPVAFRRVTLPHYLRQCCRRRIWSWLDAGHHGQRLYSG